MKEIDFLKKVVIDASKLITSEFEVKSKDEYGDLVTNFDYEIEKYLIDEIKKEYPDFDIVSEEFNTNNELTDNCFVIDPIDGTVNFANSIPLWVIQVACVKNSQIVASVIYSPKSNELFWADEQGAYLNEDKIHVNSFPITKGLYCVEGPNSNIGIEKMRKYNKNYRRIHCAGLEFAYVACGRYTGMIFRQNTIWDYTPGQFLVQQAGGVIYNGLGSHIGANNEETLNALKETASYNKNEKMEISNE